MSLPTYPYLHMHTPLCTYHVLSCVADVFPALHHLRQDTEASLTEAVLLLVCSGDWNRLPSNPLAFLTTTSFVLISFSSCCVLCAGRSKRPPFLLSELRGTNYHFAAVRTPPIFNPLSLQWCSFVLTLSFVLFHVYSSCSVHFFVLFPLFFSSF